MSSKNTLLQRYTAELNVNPLRTKALTAGVLSFVQEVLASHLAGVPVSASKSADPVTKALAQAKITSRAVNMAVYGSVVSAPLSHVIFGRLQRTFAGNKIALLLASNLIAAPIQTVVYLACMAIIGGATTLREIKLTIRAGFLTVMKVSWMSSPLATIFAQRYLSPELWVPFFNCVQFVLGTYFNTQVKKMKLAEEKKKARGE